MRPFKGGREGAYDAPLQGCPPVPTENLQRKGTATGGISLLIAMLVSANVTSLAATCPDCEKSAGTQSTTLQSGTESTMLKTGTESTVLQGSTDSTMLKGGTESTMLKGGTESTTLKGGTESAMLQVGTNKTMIQGGVEKQGQLNVLILMDSSHSMGENLEGTASEKTDKKINVAKKVLEETLQAIPNDLYVGLRIFGSSFHNDSCSDCQQSFLAVPIGPNNRRAIIDSVRQLTPRGLTPLAFTLMNAERDFRGLPGIHHVVLISDGIETCSGDPCTYIKRLSAMGIKMKIDIIGFGLKHDQVAQAHLNCITQASGGKYYDADTAGQLRDSIKQSITRALGDGKVSGKVITRVKEPIANPARVPVDFLDPAKVPAGFH